MTVEAALAAARRAECELDGLYFLRYFMKLRLGAKMLVGAHHHVLQAALDRTMLPPSDPQFIPRLIVNIPPGYTKTEAAAISYMARGLALDPRARFLHLSYSHALALLNSSTTRLITRTPEFQAMWPLQTRDDTDSKAMWWTTEGGGVYATSAAGQVTGFRAGHMDADRFTGALIIDDPVKPDDANSEVEREKINNRFAETIASRLAVETVPIIVIMQRIHDNDLSGHLLKGGSGEVWHHLELPVVVDNALPYPEEYTHGRRIDHGLPDGWLWPVKHNDEHETALRSHRRKFAAQYMQRPLKRSDGMWLWSEATINLARLEVPRGEGRRTVVAVDPATTNNTTSDEHGIVAATKHGPDLFTVDADASLRGSPLEWATRAIATAKTVDADAIVIETNQGGDMCESTLRNAGWKGRVIRVHASKGKVTRAEPVAALYEQGFVKHRAGLSLLEDEMLDLDPITGKAAGKSPNRVDAAVYALTELADLSDESLSEALKLAAG